jgi:hypothetical protein
MIMAFRGKKNESDLDALFSMLKSFREWSWPAPHRSGKLHCSFDELSSAQPNWRDVVLRVAQMPEFWQSGDIIGKSERGDRCWGMVAGVPWIHALQCVAGGGNYRQQQGQTGAGVELSSFP